MEIGRPRRYLVRGRYNFCADPETYEKFIELAKRQYKTISDCFKVLMEDYILKYDSKSNIQLDNYINNEQFIPTPNYTSPWKDWQRYTKTITDIKEVDRYEQIARSLVKLWSERQNEIFMDNIGKKQVMIPVKGSVTSTRTE